MAAQSHRILGSRYEILRKIGEGGMGTVYEARHVFTRRRVAVKVLSPEHARDPERSRRFLQEAQAAGQLAHPHIVEILDFGEDEKEHSKFIAFEYLEGKDLATHIEERGHLAVDETLAFSLPVMDALASAHRQGILHRDVKPSNIFLALGTQGAIVPKLIDFGISRVRSPELPSALRTQTGMTMGTAEFMSPEQVLAAGPIDERADIWSMGVVLYQCLTGRSPFSAHSYEATVLAVHNRNLEPVHVVRPEIPEAVGAAVGRALERDPQLRHPTMGAFAEALQAAAAAVLPPARTADTPARVAAAAPAAKPPSPTLPLWSPATPDAPASAPITDRETDPVAAAADSTGPVLAAPLAIATGSESPARAATDPVMGEKSTVRVARSSSTTQSGRRWWLAIGVIAVPLVLLALFGWPGGSRSNTPARGGAEALVPSVAAPAEQPAQPVLAPVVGADASSATATDAGAAPTDAATGAVKADVAEPAPVPTAAPDVSAETPTAAPPTPPSPPVTASRSENSRPAATRPATTRRPSRGAQGGPKTTPARKPGLETDRFGIPIAPED